MPVRHEFADDAAFEEALRDWFAGQALCGFTSFSLDDGEPFMGAADTAKAAYNYADAMLAERERVQ